ncbi:outer membrane lipoprotein carrier protein LolA [Sphingorhabdus sp. IMCC26285]|jgi:outer membrane lipoprotein-sorting protein|uniref:Outer membrane lipoprotein carrier protein LolA n=1 Tax=Sphingorhabdus profundilacus TaxID=2509718 RepID=A0A6I4M388_9SPHN|nr:outer membrane lipoprotein carrier protein LolA [Sphingorhabdus profundilacus]MVZ98420.1 outer membrane lipoprotein carrier protein LolA [Sphingorhabdus profundilacus]
MTFGKYALMLAPVALVLTVPGSAQNSPARMDQVVAHMKAVSTMTSTFTQTDRRGGTLSGKLLLKRPGHVRFEYQKDVPLLIVGDGKALTMVDYEVRQVQRWPIRNSPLAALLDPGQDLRRFGKIVETSTNDVISVAVRDPKRPEFGVITMVFVRKADAPGGLTLNGWVALDSKNNRSTIRLADVKYNDNIPSSAFTWKDPRPVRRKS